MSTRWSEADYREFISRPSSASHVWEAEYRELISRHATQLPLGKELGKPKRINTSALEFREAERLIRWVDDEGAKRHPELAYLYAIPNGGFRHKAVAGKMKAQGVKAGVLDFNLDVGRGGYHGLRLELKRRVGGTVSPVQKTWIEWLTAQGYLAIVCKGWEEARDCLLEYLSLECYPPPP